MSATMSGVRSRTRSKSRGVKTKKKSDLLSGIPDASDLNLLLDGPEQILGLKEHTGRGPGGPPLFTQQEMVIYKRCIKKYITDIKQNEKLIIPHKNPDRIKVREFTKSLQSDLDDIDYLLTKIQLNNMGKDKETKGIFNKHQKQMDQIVKTIKRLMSIHSRRIQGLHGIVGGPKNVNRLTGPRVKTATEMLRDREQSRKNKRKTETQRLHSLEIKYKVPSDFDEDKELDELHDMGYRGYRKGQKGKNKKASGKKASGKKASGKKASGKKGKRGKKGGSRVRSRVRGRRTYRR